MTPTYYSWRSMLNRCHAPLTHNYECWGGAGIQVCERWLKFENFLEDMGERPLGTTLDRFPDKKGNYAPGNCRWATPREQNNNRNWTRKEHGGNLSHCKSKPYRTRVKRGSKVVHVGYFTTKEEAQQAYKRARMELEDA